MLKRFKSPITPSLINKRFKIGDSNPQWRFKSPMYNFLAQYPKILDVHRWFRIRIANMQSLCTIEWLMCNLEWPSVRCLLGHCRFSATRSILNSHKVDSCVANQFLWNQLVTRSIPVWSTQFMDGILNLNGLFQIMPEEEEIYISYPVNTTYAKLPSILINFRILLYKTNQNPHSTQ